MEKINELIKIKGVFESVSIILLSFSQNLVLQLKLY